MGRNQQGNTELSLKMKTRLLIIIGITIGIIILGTMIYLYAQDSDCNRPGSGCIESEKRISEIGLKKDIISNNQECAELFDKIYGEFLTRPIPVCELPTSNVQCEPVLLTHYFRYNEEFNELECPLNIKDWAYLTENNDLVWSTLSPHYTFKMEKVNTEKTIPIIISKYGFDPCDNFYVYIISHHEKRELVETMSYSNICAIEPYEKKFKRFTFDLTGPDESFELKQGEYIIYLFHEPVSQFHFTENHEEPPYYQEELTKFYFSAFYSYDESWGPAPIDDDLPICDPNPEGDFGKCRPS